MDPKELCGLYEAYQQVNAPQEVDESKHDSITFSGGGNRRARKSADMRKPYNDTMKRQDQLAMSKGKPFNDRVKKDSPMQYKSNEEVDIYDIVLSHLLDEGYADTIESAEAIMVNMSEEWREDIIDEGLGKLAALGAAGLMMTQTGFKAPPGLLNKPLKEPQKTELVSKPKPTKSRDEKAERSQFDKRYNEYGGDAAARKRGLLPPK